MADRHFLGRGDLHVVDVVAVPDRLEDACWRTAAPACSAPSPCPGNGRCDRPGARRRPCGPWRSSSRADGQVGAERLFDDDPADVARGLVGQPGRAQLGRPPARKAAARWPGNRPAWSAGRLPTRPAGGPAPEIVGVGRCRRHDSRSRGRTSATAPASNVLPTNSCGRGGQLLPPGLVAQSACARSRRSAFLPAAASCGPIRRGPASACGWSDRRRRRKSRSWRTCCTPVVKRLRRLYCASAGRSENRLGEGDSPILLRGLRKIGTVPGGFRIGSLLVHAHPHAAGAHEGQAVDLLDRPVGGSFGRFVRHDDQRHDAALRRPASCWMTEAIEMSSRPSTLAISASTLGRSSTLNRR